MEFWKIVRIQDCLILELVGKEKDNKEIARKVALIPGVSSQLVELRLQKED